MKKLLFLILCFSGLQANAQKIIFGYDEAGNQINRFIVFNRNQIEAKEKFRSFDAKDNFTYYPNPVSEELNLKWDKIENKTITSIIVFSSNGVLIKNIENLEAQNQQVISFSDMAQGIYFVNLIYNDGKNKTIKILKK